MYLIKTVFNYFKIPQLDYNRAFTSKSKIYENKDEYELHYDYDDGDDDDDDNNIHVTSQTSTSTRSLTTRWTWTWSRLTTFSRSFYFDSTTSRSTSTTFTTRSSSATTRILPVDTTIVNNSDSSNNSTMISIVTVRPTTQAENNNNASTDDSNQTSEPNTNTKADYFKIGFNNSTYKEIVGKDDYLEAVFFNISQIQLNNYTYKVYLNYMVSVNGRFFLRSATNQLEIFPFGADADLRLHGSIRYNQIFDQNLLELISDDVNEYCPNLSFKSTWAFLITWNEVRPYNSFMGNSYHGANSAYKNTFQMILTTDGRNTFSIFNYERLDWPNSFINMTFESGYTDGFNFNFNNIEYSLESKNKSRLLHESNINNPGRWVIKFDNRFCN